MRPPTREGQDSPPLHNTGGSSCGLLGCGAPQKASTKSNHIASQSSDRFQISVELRLPCKSPHRTLSEAASRDATPCHARMPPDRKSVVRPGFQPDSNRASGRRSPAEGPTSNPKSGSELLPARDQYSTPWCSEAQFGRFAVLDKLVFKNMLMGFEPYQIFIRTRSHS
jgi:hypothetical protein